PDRSIFLSQCNHGGVDTNVVCIHRRGKRPPDRLVRKSETRVGGRWPQRSLLPADRLLPHKMREGHSAGQSSRELPPRYTISLHDKPNDHQPLAKRVLEIDRPGILSLASTRRPAWSPQAKQTSGPVACAVS